MFGGPLQYSDLPKPGPDPLCDLKNLEQILEYIWYLGQTSRRLNIPEGERIYVNTSKKEVIEKINQMDHEQLILLIFNAGRFVGHNEIRENIKRILQIP